jgi:hypothetical protein
MKMKATDSFYTDETKLVNKGETFEVGDEHGKELESLGHATRVSGGEKAGAGPSDNKAAQPSANKAPAPITQPTKRDSKRKA